MNSESRSREKVVAIIRDAGGEIVGRTRLQKIAYLLELTGQGGGFEFVYKHYGPYSEGLAEAADVASAFGLVNEEERVAQWGGRYSIYTIAEPAKCNTEDQRVQFATTASNVGAVELELAATAAYLASAEQYEDPWSETQKRKPEKSAEGRLERAKEAYRQLMKIRTPKQLPKIV